MYYSLSVQRCCGEAIPSICSSRIPIFYWAPPNQNLAFEITWDYKVTMSSLRGHQGNDQQTRYVLRGKTALCCPACLACQPVEPFLEVHFTALQVVRRGHVELGVQTIRDHHTRTRTVDLISARDSCPCSSEPAYTVRQYAEPFTAYYVLLKCRSYLHTTPRIPTPTRFDSDTTLACPIAETIPHGQNQL